MSDKSPSQFVRTIRIVFSITLVFLIIAAIKIVTFKRPVDDVGNVTGIGQFVYSIVVFPSIVVIGIYWVVLELKEKRKGLATTVTVPVNEKAKTNSKIIGWVILLGVVGLPLIYILMNALAN